MDSLIFLGGFDDALKLLWAFGPGERITGLVVVGKESAKEFFEILFRSLDAVGQPLLTENTEEAFDEIQPGGMSRGVMKPHLWMTVQPAAGSFILMNVQVIDYHVQLAIRMSSHNLIHEPQEVDGGAPVTDVSHHLAGSNFQSSDQGLGSVPDIFIGPTLRLFGA